MQNHTCRRALIAAAAICLASAGVSQADTIPVEILDPNLQVSTVINAGIIQPIGIVFLASND